MRKIKVLYALSDRLGAQIQYIRFIENIDPNIEVKVAGYGSKCNLINLDWNLDALKNAIDPKTISLKNENTAIYADQIKSFNPDLVISDLELITSYIALDLNKELWQVSPLLFYYAATNDIKSKLNSRRRFSYSLKPLINSKDFANYAITNSSKNLIYSHFGDSSDFDIPSNFSWIRPYFYHGQQSRAAEYNLFGATIKNNKSFLNTIKSHQDSVIFSSFLQENYDNIKLKDLRNTNEYAINLKNAKYVSTYCYTDFLADCYYNNKFSNMFVDYDDIECVINYLCTEFLKLGKSLNEKESFSNSSIEVKVNSNIKFLDQHIMELYYESK